MKPNWMVVALVGLLLAAGVLLLVFVPDQKEIAIAMLFGGLGLAVPAGVVRSAAPLLLVAFLGLTAVAGCGGAFASMEDDACKATRDSCDLALASQARYCGPDAVPGRATACALTSASAAVCVASLQLWCPMSPVPAIQRTYPGDVAAQPPQEEEITMRIQLRCVEVSDHPASGEAKTAERVVLSAGASPMPIPGGRAFDAKLKLFVDDTAEWGHFVVGRDYVVDVFGVHPDLAVVSTTAEEPAQV